MNTSEIKTIKVKLIQVLPDHKDFKADIKSIIEAIESILTSDADTTIFTPKLSDQDLEAIRSKFDASIQSGVSGGCYGARDGKSYEGYTLWLPLDRAQEYFNEEYKEYCLNPIHEIEMMGGEFLDYSEDQIEAYITLTEDSNVKVHHDNTYNHETENCYLMCDLDIKMFGDLDDDGPAFLAVRFHCGGDIRGNYTRWYLVKFDSQYDIYSAIFPIRELEENED